MMSFFIHAKYIVTKSQVVPFSKFIYNSVYVILCCSVFFIHAKYIVTKSQVVPFSKFIYNSVYVILCCSVGTYSSICSWFLVWLLVVM